MIKPATYPSPPPTLLPPPVLIVTGFLGAGKTTFLKNYLHATDTNNIRIGLVRNEFAPEFDNTNDQDPSSNSRIFEEPLLVDDDNAHAFKSFIEFPNTCVCCSARSRFIQAVTRLAEIGFEENRPFQLILVEVSGLTDPTVIAEEIFTASIEDEASPIRFGGVVTIVDTRALIDTSWFNQTKHQHEIEICDSSKENGEMPTPENVLDSFCSLLTRQISASDLILLNKIDLLDQVNVLETLKAKIQSELNPFATLKEVSYSQMKIQELMAFLKHNSSLESRTGGRLSQKQAFENKDANACAHVLDCIKVDQVEIDLPENYSPTALQDNINRYIWALEDSGAGSLLRGKGILRHDKNGVNSHYLIQIVRGVVDISKLNNSSTLPKNLNSVLMLIGTGLNRQRITESLELATPQT